MAIPKKRLIVGIPQSCPQQRRFERRPNLSLQKRLFAILISPTERRWNPGYEGDTDAVLSLFWPQNDPISPIQTFARHSRRLGVPTGPGADAQAEGDPEEEEAAEDQ